MGELSVGASLAPLVVRPSTISLFRFSAVTWNPHRIHYDRSYAATESYPDVLVHSHLHGSWILAAVRRGFAKRGVVEEFSWQNRHYAVPGDELTITGEVTDITGNLITCVLRETNQDGVVCASGRAVLRLIDKGKS